MLRFAVFCVGIGSLVLSLEPFFKHQIKLDVLQQNQGAKEAPCLYVQASGLNVRKNPSTQAQILQTLPKWTQICEYFGVENGFLRIQKGYIAVEHLSLSNAHILKNVASNSNAQNAPLKQKPKILLTSTQKIPTQNPLQLARLAIEHQDYAKAKTLALKINQDNPKNIESWEIFARALYLEGNKTEAILLLQNFLLQHYDLGLSQLLEQMQQGRVI